MTDNVITSNFYTMRDDRAETTFRYPVEIIKKPKGAKGDKGTSAKVVKTIATALDEGAQPTVTHTTSYNADSDTNETSITFGIPQGKTGYTPKVESIETRTLAAGEDASVLIEQGEKNPKDVKITVSIPQGDKGTDGKQGAKGLPAIIEKTRAYESDEPHSAIKPLDPEKNSYELELGLPRGEKGDTPPTPNLLITSITFTDDEGGAKAITSFNEDKNAYEVNLTLPKFKGDKGDDGVSPRFIGSYDSLGEISATPEYANLATVTTDGVDELFFYDGQQWQNMATLTGAKGLPAIIEKTRAYESDEPHSAIKPLDPEKNTYELELGIPGASTSSILADPDLTSLIKDIVNKKIKNFEEAYPSTFTLNQLTHDMEAEIDAFSSPGEMIFNIPVNHGSKFFFYYEPDSEAGLISLEKNYYPMSVYEIPYDDFVSEVTKNSTDGNVNDYPTALPTLLYVINASQRVNDYRITSLPGSASTDDGSPFQDEIYVNSIIYPDDFNANNVYIILATPIDNDVFLNDEISSKVKEIIA